jgi:hypothetical protein
MSICGQVIARAGLGKRVNILAHKNNKKKKKQQTKTKQTDRQADSRDLEQKSLHLLLNNEKWIF